MTRRLSVLTRALGIGAAAAVAAASFTAAGPAVQAAPGAGALTNLDTSTANRRAPAPGLYDWSTGNVTATSSGTSATDCRAVT